MDTKQITQAMTATPKDFTPDYDWRKEPWVNDESIRSLSYYIAHHVLTSMAALPDKDNPTKMEEEDARVFSLLRPDLMERIWKSGEADEFLRNREVCAAAQGIDDLISTWIARLGNIDHYGPPTKPRSIPTQVN